MKRKPFVEADRSVNSIVKFHCSPFNDRVLTTSNTAPQRIPLLGQRLGQEVSKSAAYTQQYQA